MPDAARPRADDEPLEDEALQDALTELGTRRAYEIVRAKECGRSRRYDRPLSLAIFDLDGFKRVNDRLGRAAGDVVLRAVAEIFSESRLSDHAFRIGDDEFAVLLPETGMEGALAAAKRLSDRVRSSRLGDGTLSASYGVAESNGDGIGMQDRAEKALAAAKQAKLDAETAGPPVSRGESWLAPH